ncbi:rRNA-processing protein UTP23 homolog [Branchiostoma floridae x Branchiostoma japonicum]
MKVKRQKNVRHVLSFYKNNFSYYEPYQVLIDGTFCKAALQFKVDIKEQLPKYLEGNVQLLTTSCVLAELEAFGPLMYGAFLVAKRFKPRKCGHKGEPLPAADCLLSLIKPHNEHHYFVATQDPLLTQKLKNIPAVPLLYLNKATPVLDRPSARSVAKAEGLQDTKIGLSKHEASVLKAMKDEPTVQQKKKRKRPKAPNPLSCKPKKQKTSDTGSQMSELAAGKKKRKRKRKGKKQSSSVTITV